MRRRSAHDGEAIGLAACAQACAVRLRPSSADILLTGLRWALTVAGAVVAMWAGATLLATPASAAVVVPMAAAVQTAAKGGKEKPSGDSGNNGGDKNTSKNDSESSKATGRSDESENGKSGSSNNGDNGKGPQGKKGDAQNDGDGGGRKNPDSSRSGNGAGGKPKHGNDDQVRTVSDVHGPTDARPGKGPSDGKPETKPWSRRPDAGGSGKGEKAWKVGNTDGNGAARNGDAGDGQDEMVSTKTRKTPAPKNADSKKLDPKNFDPKNFGAGDIKKLRDEFAKDPEAAAEHVRSFVDDTVDHAAGDKKAAAAAAKSAKELRKVVTGAVEKYRDKSSDSAQADRNTDAAPDAEKQLRAAIVDAVAKHTSGDMGAKNGKSAKNADDGQTVDLATLRGDDVEQAVRAKVERAVSDAIDRAAAKADRKPADKSAEQGAEKKSTADKLVPSTADVTKVGKKAAKQWQAFGDRMSERVDAVRTAAENHGDVRAAVAKLVKEAAQAPGIDRVGGDVRAAGKAAIAYTMAPLHDAGSKAGAQKTDADLAALGTGATGCPAGGSGCGAAATELAGMLRSASSRGPPGSRQDDYAALSSGSSGSGHHGREHSGGWDDAQATDQLLKDRIAADNGAKDLAADKAGVAAGKMTAADYAKSEARQKQREQQLAQSREHVSSDRAELVDDVVDGQTELSTARTKLDAQAQQVKAGKVTQAAYDENAAAYDDLKNDVYDKTDELRQATDHSSPNTVSDHSAGDGSAAGCGSSGVFVECRSISAGQGSRSGDDRNSDDRTGGEQTDRCLAVAGVSSGCGVSTGSGDTKASASCTLTGANQGCGSSSSKGDVSANAWCALGSGDCGQSSRATSDGASMACETDSGSCRGDTTGPAAKPSPAATAQQDRPVLTAACTGRCGVDGMADRWGADGSCHTDAGTCDSSSTGAARNQQEQGTRAAARTVADEQLGKGAATGHCTAATGGCDLTTTVQVDEGRSASVDAKARCGQGATGCNGTAATTSGAQSTVTPAAVQQARDTDGAANCSMSGGACAAHTESTAADGDHGRSDATVSIECGQAAGCTGKGDTATKAGAAGLTAGLTRAGTGAAGCSVTDGGCGASSSTVADNPTSTAEPQWKWDAATGTVGTLPAVATDGDGSAHSETSANVDCGQVATCTGAATTATTGHVTAPGTAAAAVRDTKADANCTASAGDCSIGSSSQVGDTAKQTASVAGTAATQAAATRELTASSAAGAGVDCQLATCTGTGASGTSGGASGDVVGVRDSSATSNCTAHGAGASCAADTNTDVADRAASSGTDTTNGVTAVTGPVSTSAADATVSCTDALTACGGSTAAATSARDTAVSPQARGTSATSECTVTGGGCQGQSGSKASSAPDFVVVDPETGKPVAGQPLTGPTSTSSSSAGLDCAAGANCSGTVATGTTAWDGAVNGGAPRTSQGTASCAAGTGACQVQSVSNASTGPGAALTFAGQDQATNLARLAAGPSAASAAGAALTCAGELVCTGKVTSAADAVDPAVSPDPRGSHSEGSCAGVTGGVCQAVTNSGASTGPDADRIAPLVQAASTDNATVTSGTTGGDQPGDQKQDPTKNQQPATTPAAPTAPGSSANNGGPTVPGASSWTMANATLNCAGGTIGCAGTASSSAAGSDGPNAVNGANGARGPPEGGSRTSGTCAAAQSGCQVQTSSTAGSGQVVADIVAENQNEKAAQLAEQAEQAQQDASTAQQVAAQQGATAEQKKQATDAAAAAKTAKDAAQQAAELAKKPVTGAPATYSTSTAAAQCAGAGCAAGTTGDTFGLAGVSHTAATCVAAANGCADTSNAAATLDRNLGQAEDGKPIPGLSGSGQTSSTAQCPDKGCTATLTAKADVTAGPAGRQSHSTADGATACAGTGPCVAQVAAGTSATTAEPGAKADEQFGNTSAYAMATCDDGTAAGCATTATSRTDATGGATVQATGTATCAAAGACQAGTGGTAAKDTAQAQATCAGTACRTHTDGAGTATSTGGHNTATARSDCTAGTKGQCVSTVQVGASEAAAEAGAACAGTDGSTCSYSYRAESHAKAAGARADAVGHGEGAVGGGQAITTAAAAGGPGYAQASASCMGSAGTNCHYAYRAESHATAAGAHADAVGYGEGAMGGGQVVTTATAAAGPGYAQASASCMGSAGTNCHYDFSATVSASAKDPKTGSHAEAYAHGSGAGGMGGGGVAVAAQAWAKGNQAGASASCVGAANCTSTFSAFAQDWASAGDDKGRDDAYHWMSCSGSGNGGCSVVAIAVPGDAVDGGFGRCTGYCANAEEGGYNHHTTYATPTNTDPIKAVQNLGPGEYGIGWKPDGKGGYTVIVKDPNKDPVTYACPAPCKPGSAGADVHGDKGQHVVVTDKGVQTTNPSVQGKPDDSCTASDGCGLARDAAGNGKYWVNGSGHVHDGVSGSDVEYVGGNPHDPPKTPVKNDGSFANPLGSPFTTTCAGGCKGTISNVDIGFGVATDHINYIVDTPGILVGRDGFGHAGTLDFAGTGKVTTAEGVVTDVVDPASTPLPKNASALEQLEANLISPVQVTPGMAPSWTRIRTPDSNGTPGKVTFEGHQSGSVAYADGYKVAIQDGAAPTPLLTAGLYGEPVEADLPLAGDVHGTIKCNGACTLTRPDGMVQNQPCAMYCSITEQMIKPGETGAFTGVVFQGGGVGTWKDPYGNAEACDAGGTFCQVGMIVGPGGGGYCHGKDCHGKTVDGQTIDGQGTILFPIVGPDGKKTNIGAGCLAKTTCTTNTVNLGLSGVPEPSWMARVDPTYTRPAQDTALDRAIAKAQGRDFTVGMPLPPLDPAGEAWLATNHPELVNAYETSLPGMTLEQTTRAGVGLTQKESFVYQTATELDKKIPGLKNAIDHQIKANQGGLTPQEIVDLQPDLKIIDDAAATNTELASARDFIDSITGLSYQRYVFDKQAQLGGKEGLPGRFVGSEGSLSDQQKRLYLQMFDEYGLDANGDPKTLPSDDVIMRTSAADVVHMNLMARTEAYNANAAALKQKIDSFNDHPGTQAERNALVTEQQQLDAEYKAITETIPKGYQELTNGLPPAIRPGQTKERAYDHGFLSEDDNPTLTRTLQDWDGLQTAAANLATAMKASGDPRQAKLAGAYESLGTTAQLMYDSHARDMGFRGQNMLIGDMALPSTGRPDVAFAVRAAYNLPSFKKDTAVKAFVEQGNLDGLSTVEAGPADRLANAASQGSADRVMTSDVYRPAQVQMKDGQPVVDQKVKDGAKGFAKDGAVWESFNTVYMHDGKTGLMTIVRVTNPDGSVRFIDPNGNYYGSRDDFYRNNEMLGEHDSIASPDDWRFLSPKTAGGTFRPLTNAEVEQQLDTVHTTQTGGKYVSGWDKAKGWVYLGAGVVASAAIIIGSGGTATPLVAAGWALAGTTAAVGTVDFLMEANNRSNHGQSNNPFTNANARAMWLGEIANLANLVTAGVGGTALRASVQAGRAVELATATTATAATRATAETAAATAASWNTTLKVTGYTALALNAPAFTNAVVMLHQGWGEMTTGERANNVALLAANVLAPFAAVGAAKIVSSRTATLGATPESNARLMSVDDMAAATKMTRAQVVQQAMAEPGVELVDLDGVTYVRQLNGEAPVNPATAGSARPALPAGEGEGTNPGSLPAEPVTPSRPLPGARQSVPVRDVAEAAGVSPEEIVRQMQDNPNVEVVELDGELVIRDVDTPATNTGDGSAGRFPDMRMSYDGEGSGTGGTVDGPGDSFERGNEAILAEIERLNGGPSTEDGAAAAQPGDAGTVRAAPEDAQNSDTMTAAERDAVDAAVAKHGGKFLDRPNEKEQFLADPHGYLTDSSKQWPNNAVGEAVEGLGAELVTSQLEPGQKLLPNVQIEIVRNGKATPLDEIDFLVVDDNGVVREISAKASRLLYKQAAEQKKLQKLLRDFPESLKELREYLAAQPRKRPMTQRELDAVEGIQVSIAGGKPMSLAEFRAQFVKGTDPSTITPEPLMPAGPDNFGHQLVLTRDQIVQALVDSGLRRLGIDPVEWVMDGQPTRLLGDALLRLGQLRGMDGPATVADLAAELAKQDGYELFRIPGTSEFAVGRKPGSGGPSPVMSLDEPEAAAAGTSSTADLVAELIAIKSAAERAGAGKTAVTRIAPGEVDAAAVRSAVETAAAGDRVGAVVVDARANAGLSLADAATGVRDVTAAQPGRLNSVAVWTADGVATWSADGGLTVRGIGPPPGVEHPIVQAMQGAPELPADVLGQRLRLGTVADLVGLLANQNRFVLVERPGGSGASQIVVRDLGGPDGGPEGGTAGSPAGGPGAPRGPDGRGGGRRAVAEPAANDQAPTVPAEPGPPVPASDVPPGALGPGTGGGSGGGGGGVADTGPAGHGQPVAAGAAMGAERPAAVPALPDGVYTGLPPPAGRSTTTATLPGERSPLTAEPETTAGRMPAGTPEPAQGRGTIDDVADVMGGAFRPRPITEVADQLSVSPEQVWQAINDDPRARFDVVDGHVIRRIGGGAVHEMPDGWRDGRRMDPLDTSFTTDDVRQALEQGGAEEQDVADIARRISARLGKPVDPEAVWQAIKAAPEVMRDLVETVVIRRANPLAGLKIVDPRETAPTTPTTAAEGGLPPNVEVTVVEGPKVRFESSFQERLDALKQRLAEHRSRIGSGENPVEAAQRVAELERRVAKLEGRYDPIAQRAADLQNRINTINAEVSDLESQIRRSVGNRSGYLRGLQNERLSLQHLLDKMGDSAATSRRGMAAQYEARLTEIDATLAGLKQAEAELRAQYEQAGKQGEELDRLVADGLEKQHRQAVEELQARYDQTVRERTAELDDLQHELSELRTAREAVQHTGSLPRDPASIDVVIGLDASGNPIYLPRTWRPSTRASETPPAPEETKPPAAGELPAKQSMRSKVVDKARWATYRIVLPAVIAIARIVHPEMLDAPSVGPESAIVVDVGAEAMGAHGGKITVDVDHRTSSESTGTSEGAGRTTDAATTVGADPIELVSDEQVVSSGTDVAAPDAPMAKISDGSVVGGSPHPGRGLSWTPADIPIWDRRLDHNKLRDVGDPALSPSIGGFLQGFSRASMSTVERVMPPGLGIETEEWRRLTPAQRAEAWQEAADTARKRVEQLQKEMEEQRQKVEQLRQERQRLEAEVAALQQQADALRTYGERFDRSTLGAWAKGLVIRAHARLSGAERMTRQEWRQETQQVAQELTIATRRHAQAVTDHAELARQVGQFVEWAQAQIATLGGRAELADAYGAVHREVAGWTRMGRKDLKLVDEFRKQGKSTWRAARAIWRLGMLDRLAKRDVPTEVIEQLKKLVGATDRGLRIEDLIASGVATDEDAGAYFARFSDAYGLDWTTEVRDALLKALPRKLRQAMRVTQPPRHAGLSHRQEARARIRLGLTTVAIGGAGLTVMLTGVSATTIVGVPTLALAAVGALLYTVHMVRVRGPPSLPIVLFTGVGLVLFVGGLIWAGLAVSMTLLAGSAFALAGAAVLSMLRRLHPTWALNEHSPLLTVAAALAPLALLGLAFGFAGASGAEFLVAGLGAFAAAIALGVRNRLVTGGVRAWITGLALLVAVSTPLVATGVAAMHDTRSPTSISQSYAPAPQQTQQAAPAQQHSNQVSTQQAPAPAEQPRVVKVLPTRVTVTVRGESLWVLDDFLGLPHGSIAAANPDRFPAGDPQAQRLIHVGESFRIPAGWNGTVVVQPGTNLTVIAHHFPDVTPERFSDEMPHRFPDAQSRDHIRSGERLDVPTRTVVIPPVHKPVIHEPDHHNPPPPAQPNPQQSENGPVAVFGVPVAAAIWFLLHGALVVVGLGNVVIRVVKRIGKGPPGRGPDDRPTPPAPTKVSRLWAQAKQRLGTGAGAAAVEHLVDAERELALARQDADRAPEDEFAAAALRAAQQARDRARAEVDALAGGAIWDVVRLGVSDERLANALGVPVVVTTVLTAPARAALVTPTGREPRWYATTRVMAVLRDTLDAARKPVEDARTAMAPYESYVVEYRHEVQESVRGGIRWVMHPQGREPGGDAELAQLAQALDLPIALVRSYAFDDEVRADVPPLAGVRPEKHRSFEADLQLVVEARDEALRMLANAEREYDEKLAAWYAALSRHRTVVAAALLAAVVGGATVDEVAKGASVPVDLVRSVVAGAGIPTAPDLGPALAASDRNRNALKGGSPTHPVTTAAGGRHRLTNPIRGPPRIRTSGLLGKGRELRGVLRKNTAWNRWKSFEQQAASAAARERAVREDAELRAGGLLAIVRGTLVDLGELAEATESARELAAERDRARADFVTAITPAAKAAAESGLRIVAIMNRTDLDWATVSAMTDLAQPDSGHRTRWDPLIKFWMGFWGIRHPAKHYVLADGRRVSEQWLQTQLALAGGGELAMQYGRVIGLTDKSRMPTYLYSDGHFHHAGYDHPRTTSIKGFLDKLRDAGHQGVITFHPIPQRGKGSAPLGGLFYYAVANVLTLGLVFDVPMLHMWGKYPDVLLLDAVRRLPRHLRWRAVLGVVGERLDVPGALGYLQAMAVINPDVAQMVGETTIAKEAVTVLLGSEAIQTLNPEWEIQIERLVTAAGLLRAAVRDPASGIGVDDLPPSLQALVAGERDASGRDPMKLIPALLVHVDAVRSLLVAAGHEREAEDLMSRAQLESLDVYNPNVRELFEASSRIGYLVVLHNDFGLARILADARFGEATPDERFGMPLLSLLAEYPDAKINLAHLGVGKWTTLSVEHLDLIDAILDDDRFAHISFDISWNEVARHLQATTEITDRFIGIVEKHHARIISGTDAVKPESYAQYVRWMHDMEPVFARIRNEVGEQAYHDIAHANLERQLAAAKRDVQRWAYVQLASGAWDGFRAEFSPERNAVVDDWLRRYELAVGEPSAAELAARAKIELVGPGDWKSPDTEGAEQVRSFVRWHNAVTVEVGREGKLLTWRLFVTAVKAEIAARKEAREKKRAATAQARVDRRGLARATGTEALELVDADGTPWTIDALVGAYQTKRATGDQQRARWVLGEIQRTELAQRADRAEIDRLRHRLWIWTGIAGALTVTAVVLGWVWLTPIASMASYGAFAARGALNSHRMIYVQQMRVLVESILERGQFNLHTIRRLAQVIGKYAAFDRAPAKRLSEFDKLADEIEVEAQILVETKLGDESANSRFETQLTLFSRFLDRASSTLGAQAQSFHGLNPHGGLLGRLLNTALAGTFVINLMWHAPATLAAWASGSVLEVFMNGLFALADVLFLAQALPAVATGWVGYDASAHPAIRTNVHLIAMPVITVANALLSIYLAFSAPSLLVVPAIALTWSSAYLTKLGLVAESWLGRLQPRRGAWANIILNVSLMSFGVVTLLPTHGVALLVTVIVAPLVILGVSKLDTRLAKRMRKPKGSGRGRFRRGGGAALVLGPLLLGMTAIVVVGSGTKADAASVGGAVSNGGGRDWGTLLDGAGNVAVLVWAVAAVAVVTAIVAPIVARARGPPARVTRAATDEDLARIRDDLIVFDNGVILAPSRAWRREDGTVGEDRLRFYGPELRVDGRSFVLVTHADEHGIFFPAAEADIRLSPAQVRELLQALPEFQAWRADGGLSLTTPACRLACAPVEYRRGLAGGLGVTVRAPDVDVDVHPAQQPGAAARVRLVSRDDGSAGGWVDVLGDGSVRPAPPPTSLVEPALTPDARRLAPISHPARGPPAPALPVRAGGDERQRLHAAAIAALGYGPAQQTPTLSEKNREVLAEARKNTPANWVAPARTGHSHRVRRNSPARPAYEVLRDVSPGDVGDVPLQGTPRPKIGDIDPARPHTTITKREKGGNPNVSADHVIPLAEIMNLPGFMRLNPDNMIAIANARLNLQWLSSPVNSAKGSRSAADTRDVDPAWQKRQVAFENLLRTKLQDIVNGLLVGQGEQPATRPSTVQGPYQQWLWTRLTGQRPARAHPCNGHGALRPAGACVENAARAGLRGRQGLVGRG